MSLALAQNGVKVYIASRKMAVLQATADELNADALVKKAGGHVVPIRADLRTRKDCEGLAKEIMSRETKLNILINNSWVFGRGGYIFACLRGS